jgi:WD40 repeat protein
MPDDGAMIAGRQERLEQVIGAYLEAADAGAAPDPGQWVAAHPDLNPELAEFLADECRLDRFVGLRQPAIRVIDSTASTQSAPATATSYSQGPGAPTLSRSPGEETTDFSPGEDVTQAAHANQEDLIDGDPARGTRVRYFGDYELLAILGRGGMGVVYRARQVSLRRLVAVKMLRSGAWASEDEVRRFHNEAGAVAELDHPGILPVYEVGEHSGRHYFSMKLIEGPSLSECLDRYIADSRAAAHLVAQVARAVHHAHMRGILHRDLKPANILLDSEGQPHITDFGLAKRTDGELELTETGAVLGTPGYMSPEQAEGRKRAITTATDVHGLGAILYAMLTGRAPFAGDSVAETLQRVRERTPDPPSHLNRRLNRDLEVICLKCLEKEPKQRYASAEALAEDLERWLSGLPISARPVSTAERVWRWGKRNPAIAAAAALAVSGLLAASGLSVVIAVREARAAELIGVAKRKTDEALGTSRRLSARMALDRGLSLCEQGHADCGLLWLGGGLQLAPAEANDLKRLLRLSFAGWHPQVHPLKAILEHQAQVLTVAFEPGGRTILTGGYDHAARLWDVGGMPLGDPWQHQSAVGSVKFSPDGRSALILGYGGVARIWDVATGKPVGEPLPHKPFVRSAAWSPDGRTVLTCGTDGSVWLWNAATREPVLKGFQAHGKPLTHEGDIHVTAFSPDGKTFVTGSNDHTARLWDAATGRAIGTPMQHQDRVIVAAFSPDGKTILTASFDHSARLWDAGSGKPRMQPMWHPGGLYAATFSPDGKMILTGGGERVGRLWEAATGRPLGSALPHRGGISVVGFSPDGRVALTGSSDNTARIWDVATGLPVGGPLRHQGFLQDAGFRPDGRFVLTGSYDNSARLWDASAGPIPTLLRHEDVTREQAVELEPMMSRRAPALRSVGLITVAVFSPDGRIVVTGDWNGTARVWDVATGKPLGKPLKHRDPIMAAAFHAEGKTILIGTGRREFPIDEVESRDVIRRGEARLWNIADSALLPFSIALPDRIQALAYSPDGRKILTGSADHTARLWDAATGQPLGPPLEHQGGVHTVAFSADGKVALTADHEVAQRWDVASGQSLGPPLRHRGQGTTMELVFRRDGQAALAGSDDHTARVYGTTTGKPLGPPLRHQGMVAAVAFSPDGKLAVTGSQDATARVWDVATGRPVSEPLRHQGQVLDVAFSRDGKTLLTASYDDVVQLWDVATGKPVGPPWMHPIFVRSVSFSPDGKYALTLTGGDEGRNIARLWKVPTPIEGDADRLSLWAQTLTGMELDSDDAVRSLDAATWRARLNDLNKIGGPPPG